MKTIILTDNSWALDLAKELNDIHGDIDVFQSPNGKMLPGVPKLNVRTQVSKIVEKYNLILSIHCMQIFPAALINQILCVNVHPGFNPYNRGWFPQVFSIINGLKAGVTIHEIDEQLDHGPIIAQKEYRIESWDTSISVYIKIMEIEREIVLENFSSIREGTYKSRLPSIEGNLNHKQDFDRLKRLDLDEQGVFRDFLNRLRALTHGDFKNAYYIDESGKRIFIRVILEPE